MNPLHVYLNVLQLEGYEVGRFVGWWVNNPMKLTLEGKKPLVWTIKARIVYFLAWALWLGVLGMNFWLGLVTMAIPWIWLVLAAVLLRPVEWWWCERVKDKTRRKIEMLKAGGLRVIAISGSYGKTSVKEYLYQCLKGKYRVVRTPESYNTVLGIARVVDMELWEDTQVFICEMGAYKRGDTQELCEMIDPDYAMLTGINEQHLERFGSLDNEIAGESESVKYVLKKGGPVVVNWGNKYVKRTWEGISGITKYGEGKYELPMEQNVEGAKEMAGILGVTGRQIPKKFEPVEHRLSLLRRGDTAIIDDAFSGNTDGFKAAIDYLQTFPGWKVVVTPGLIELGEETRKIHMELGGVMRGKVDQLILVGRNERTESLELGFERRAEYVGKVGEAMARVAKERAVVLFENDLPDNY